MGQNFTRPGLAGQEDRMTDKLRPVKNVRNTLPRCCKTCKSLLENYPFTNNCECERENGPLFYKEESEEMFLKVCDLWEKSPDWNR
jgi:hypothetical protein